LANDAAIDTRKGYGDAIKNDEGKLIADPNADWSDYNFGTSLFKGGLFVGKMPAGNQDHSGTSRTQLYLPGGAISQTILSTLTMYYLGSPAHGQNAITIGAYYPSQTYNGQTDPNYATTTESNVKWSTRWLYLTQENSVSFPPSGGPPVNSWVNWTLTPTVANNTSKLTAMLTDETGTTPLWYYFSSKDNATGTGATYPITDSQPRVWLLDQTASTTWGGW